MKTGALPNLIVIGAMKCGTTSLHRNLGLHPEIGMTERKEQNFFLRKHWERHLDAYRAVIPTGFPVRGESSPDYSKVGPNPGVPARIAASLPDVKLVYMMRDPVERTVSHWVHFFASGVEMRPLEEALADLSDDNPLIDASLYHKQLQAYLEHFPLERIHVATMEGLSADPTRTMQELFGFLGVDDRFDSPTFHDVRHPSSKKRRATAIGRLARRLVGRYQLNQLRRRAPFLDSWLRRDRVEKPEFPDALRSRLEDRFRDDVAHLRALTGLACPKWSV
ncbi:MAG: sulfotransferase [Deltaproteobacteria bacterium]|nr:sulfotransferase [Deltaproteobacteria bacterium]MBW2362076.1 sulfotransferase [Deltaproteobacteria bacterium]